MKFSEWAKLQEAGFSSARTSLDGQVDPAATRNTRGKRFAPARGSPSGSRHSDPKIEVARVELGKLAQQAHIILKYVKESDHWKQYPQFQRPFLDKMTKAIDGITESQVILSSDSSTGHEGGPVG